MTARAPCPIEWLGEIVGGSRTVAVPGPAKTWAMPAAHLSGADDAYSFECHLSTPCLVTLSIHTVDSHCRVTRGYGASSRFG